MKRLAVPAAVTLLAAAAVCVIIFAGRAPPMSSAPLETTFYVWQREWSEPVRKAVARAADRADGFAVLAAEVRIEPGRALARTSGAEWPPLAQAGRPVTLVVRADRSVAEHEQAGTVSRGRFLAAVAMGRVESARGQGVQVAGVQIDFDCPTAALADYGRVLEEVREALPDLELSITALPAWLASPHFRPLVRGLAYFVLQVHSLERPTTVEAPVTLCPVEKIDGWLRQASAAGAPFYVALPTYGYRVAFDEQGRFAALAAEGPLPQWRHGYQVRIVMADSEALAPVVRGLRARHAADLRGIAWFRLPVEADELAWAWPELEAVMDGRTPHTALEAEVRSPSADLYEVWVRNAGEKNILHPIRVHVKYAPQAVAASDLLRGFGEYASGGPGEMVLVGAAPRLGPPVMIAWFRLAPAPDVPDPPVQVTQVEVLQ